MQKSKQSDITVYLEEYVRDDIIARYISETAGAGIAFVLNEVYAPIYLRAIRRLIAERPDQKTFRVLEYGCGGGMNLLKIVELLESQGRHLERGYGTDFSPPMIEAARAEAARHLPAHLNERLTYVVAGNESLAEDMSRNLGVPKDQLFGTFDMVVGVNTSRYCHRLGKELESTKDLFDLLRPGGSSVMIDMNRHFPFFRSKVRAMFKPSTIETYVPSLANYTRPFAAVGFKVEETKNFCWIPHSANPRLLAFCRTLTPALDTCFSPFAMRSLVVAQKPR